MSLDIILDTGIRVCRCALIRRRNKTIPTETLVRMTYFVLMNSFFQFNYVVKQQSLEQSLAQYAGVKHLSTQINFRFSLMEGK